MTDHELVHGSLLDLLDGLQKEMERHKYRKNALAAGRKYLERYINKYKKMFDSKNDVEILSINGINRIILVLKDELTDIKREAKRL